MQRAVGAPGAARPSRLAPSLLLPARQLTVARSKAGDGKGKGGTSDNKADPNKADFSAYWSLRIREFFSQRRQYLEQAGKGGPTESVWEKRLREQKEVEQQRLAQLQEQELVLRREGAQFDQAASAAAAAKAQDLLRPVERMLVDDPAEARRTLQEPAGPQEAAQLVEQDIMRARAHL